MGDRALIQLRGAEDCSPVLYLHWGGHDVAAILTRAQERMHTRPNDVEYAFARLVQAAVGDDDGNTGIGVWNRPEPLTAADSHGDAGCFLVDVRNPRWVVYVGGGYGFDDAPTPDFDVKKLP